MEATDVQLLTRRGDLPLDDARALVEPLARDPDRLQLEASLRLLQLIEPNELKASRTADRSDKERYDMALGLFEKPELARAALDAAVDHRSDHRDTMVILHVALSRRATRTLAWATIRERWADP